MTQDETSTEPKVSRLNRAIKFFKLEPAIARFPKQARFAVTRRRYPWIDSLAQLQTTPRDTQSLIETEAAHTIFVHIPKAAGLSVSRSLFGNDAASHTPLYMYLALYGARKFDSMYKFTFVRDPFTRVTSAYNFLKAGGLTPTDKEWAEANMQKYDTVNDFVSHGLVRPETLRWVHFKPQSYFLTDPRNGQIGVDFVGKFETLSQDYIQVCEALKIEASLKHTNKSVQKTSPLTPESKDIIRNIYREDFTKLGYAPD